MKGVWLLITYARNALAEGDYAAVKEYLDKIHNGFREDKRTRLAEHSQKKRRRGIYSPSKKDE